MITLDLPAKTLGIGNNDKMNKIKRSSSPQNERDVVASAEALDPKENLFQNCCLSESDVSFVFEKFLYSQINNIQLFVSERNKQTSMSFSAYKINQKVSRTLNEKFSQSEEAFYFDLSLCRCTLQFAAIPRLLFYLNFLPFPRQPPSLSTDSEAAAFILRWITESSIVDNRSVNAPHQTNHQVIPQHIP